MFDLHYELVGDGWANTTFTWDDGKLEFRNQCQSNPLSHLASQARWFVDPKKRQHHDVPKAHFANQPNDVYLVVVEDSFALPVYDDEWTDLRTQEFELVLTHNLDDDDPSKQLALGKVQVEEYVTILFRELNKTWEQHGMIGYRKMWPTFDFPLADFISVGQLLDVPPPKRPLWG